MICNELSLASIHRPTAYYGGAVHPSPPHVSARVTSARCQTSSGPVTAVAAAAAAGGATPLLAAVLGRASRNDERPFHVPGHKRGRVVLDDMRRLMQGPHGPLAGDLTEIAGLDYLSSASGVISDAQALAAAAFGADSTFFLVNGCTAGIHAAVMATCPPGSTLLLARNCHLSGFNAAVLAGCGVAWVEPEADAEHGVAHCVSPEALEAAISTELASGRKLGAALVVSPTYFGAAANIQGLAAACHAAGIPLLVDEAHGAHFTPAAQQLPGDFPPGGLQLGADVSIHSTHKVLTAMTQAAMLHVKRGRVDESRVARALQILQSSSPSYLLMSSLDAARAHAFMPGAWDTPLAVARCAREGLRQVQGVTLVESGPIQPATSNSTCRNGGSSESRAPGSCGEVGEHGGSVGSVAAFDPLRLVVNASGLGVTGFEAAEWLESRHGIVPELATVKLVVLVVGPGSVMADAEALVEGIRQLAMETRGQQKMQQPQAQRKQQQTLQQQAPQQEPTQQQPQLTPREAFFAATERVPLAAAAGRVCAELLCPYPPGVPLLFPGEVISGAAVTALLGTLSSGGAVVGASDSTLDTVLVVADA